MPRRLRMAQTLDGASQVPMVASSPWNLRYPHVALSLASRKDNLDSAGGNAWSTGAVGIGPPAPDEIPMPAKERLGLDEEPSLAMTVKKPIQSSE